MKKFTLTIVSLLLVLGLSTPKTRAINNANQCPQANCANGEVLVRGACVAESIVQTDIDDCRAGGQDYSCILNRCTGQSTGSGSWTSPASDGSIYYEGGNVGIGTNQPSETLTIDGGNILVRPLPPTVVGELSLTFNGGYDLDVSGRYAYVVEPNYGIRVVDISNSTSPTIVGTVTGSEFDTASAVRVSDNYAYVAGAVSGGGLTVVNISNPTNPSVVTKITTGPGYGISSRGLDVSGNYVYMGNYSGDNLMVVDVSDPANPVVVGETPSSFSSPDGVTVAGDYAYVTDTGQNSLTVVNISNPTNPTIVGSVTGPEFAQPQKMAVKDGFVYVASYGNDRLVAVDVSDPANPTITGSVTSSDMDYAYNVYVYGRYAYVNSNSSLMTVVDISDPSNPIQVNTIGIGAYENSRATYVDGKYAYVSTFGSPDRFVVIDIAKGSVETPSANFSFVASSDVDVANNLSVDGSVGIGTSSPNYALEVERSVTGDNPVVYINGTNNESGGLRVNSAGTGGGDWVFDAQSGGTSRLFVQGDGNVGIGTTNPIAHLEVRNGSVLISGTSRLSQPEGETGGRLTIDTGASTGHEYITLRDNDGVEFRVTSGGRAEATSHDTISDERLKQNIKELSLGLEQLSKLRGVTFEWKDEEDQSVHIGMIAQEVEKIIPQVISVNNDGFKSISYDSIVPLLIKSIQEQQVQIEALKSELDALKAGQ